MYNENTKQTIPRLMSGEIAAVLDNASISGTIGAVLAKSYAP